MIKVLTLDNYDFYIGINKEVLTVNEPNNFINKPFYNIVPINSQEPNSGYFDANYILLVKGFDKNYFVSHLADLSKIFKK